MAQELGNGHDLVDKLRNTPITLNKLIALGAVWVAINQGLSLWQTKVVSPEALADVQETQESIVRSQARLAVNMDSLTTEMRAKIEGDWLLYYGICRQFKRQEPENYPRFCDRAEIVRFEVDRVTSPRRR